MRDLGRVAQVCKTWHRVSLKTAVWLHFARSLGIDVQNNDNCRANVVRSVIQTLGRSFAVIPSWVRDNVSQPIEALAVKELSICLLSPNYEAGRGKSCLTLRFVQNDFYPDTDPFMEDIYRQNIEIDGVSLRINVMDSALEKMFVEALIRQCRMYVICSTFDTEGEIEAIEALFQDIVRIRNLSFVPVLLVRTMADLELPCVEWRRLKDWIRCRDAAFVSTSAQSDFNVREAFVLAARMYFSALSRLGKGT